MWSPHWSQTWFGKSRGYSRWQESIGPMLEFARANTRLNIIFRPHPLLLAGIEARRQNKELSHPEARRSIDAVVDGRAFDTLLEFIKLPNVETSRKTLLEDVLRADALVTDGVSIIAYWASTGKPMAVLRDDESPIMNANGSCLMAACDVVSSPAELLNWLEAWPRTANGCNEQLIKASKEIFPTFEENPFRIWARSMSQTSRQKLKSLYRKLT